MRRLTALQALAGYCQRQEWIEKDPTLTLERRRVPRNENRAILFDELNAQNVRVKTQAKLAI